MAELLGRRLVSLCLRVCWSVRTTVHRVVALLLRLFVLALGWLVRVTSVEGKVAAKLTVERIDSCGEKSEG